MKLSDVSIGVKLISGFVLVVLIFGGVAAYQIAGMGTLARLQDVGAKRAEDQPGLPGHRGDHRAGGPGLSGGGRRGEIYDQPGPGEDPGGVRPDSPGGG